MHLTNAPRANTRAACRPGIARNKAGSGSWRDTARGPGLFPVSAMNLPIRLLTFRRALKNKLYNKPRMFPLRKTTF